MEKFIAVFIIIPLLGFLANAIIPARDEVRLSQVSIFTMATQFIVTLLYTIVWVFQGANTLYYKLLTLLNLHHFQLFIDFKYNTTTAVYLLVGAFIAFLITMYSRNYLHKEEGFKRFFTTILFFYLGYNMIVLSGNLTSVFVGWEIAGISSFLLIGFYRNRYIPIKNAVKIFSIYRLGDICIMLAMWLMHHLWQENVSLLAFSNTPQVLMHIQNYPIMASTFCIVIIIAAAIKSAQFPFSAWLPRAMEGPTPSSAIFYSSLAVHLGVLLLLRTYDFWSQIYWIKLVVIGLGAITWILGSISSLIQPSIKGQIAYSVVSQIGIMFVEVALGWHTLVLIHFASHAMLRSYQLLISPSVVTYSIREQFYTFTPTVRKKLNPILQNISNSIYILSLNEWYMNNIIYYLVWSPFKRIGLFFHRIPDNFMKWFSFALLGILPIILLIIKLQWIVIDPYYISVGLLVLAFIYISLSFTEKARVLYAWYDIAMYHILIVAAGFLNNIPLFHLSFYIGGISLSYVIGHYAMNNIRSKEDGIVTLHGYQGHCYEYPTTEFVFFVAILGLMGFPITSAFAGTELLFVGINHHQITLLVLLLLCILVNGLSMVRMYARIFLGPHVKSYHASARKSA